jgi:hypothetical protein
MLPVMRNHAADASAFVNPHVDFKLKPGWAFDPARRAFVSSDGSKVSVRGELPRGSKIVPTIPSLFYASEEKLSEPERQLARSMQVILPKGHDPSTVRDLISRWPFVLETHLAPAISLPSL